MYDYKFVKNPGKGLSKRQIDASDKYVSEQRDTSIVTEMMDRDIRLVTSVNKPGDINKLTSPITYLGNPRITNTTETELRL